jgi:hypothetical protein
VEEDNVSGGKIVFSWQEIVLMGGISATIYFNGASAEGGLWYFLLGTLIGSTLIKLYSNINFWQLSEGIAEAWITKTPGSLEVIAALYPYTWPRMISAFFYCACAFYVMQVNPQLVVVSLFVIFPHILSVMVYNKILRAVGNPELFENIVETQTILEEDEKRSLIFQEELNKVMPDVMAKTQARWKAEGLYLEELDEHHEPNESDQTGVSTTDDNDEPR